MSETPPEYPTELTHNVYRMEGGKRAERLGIATTDSDAVAIACALFVARQQYAADATLTFAVVNVEFDKVEAVIGNPDELPDAERL